MWFYAKDPLMVSHYPAKFGGHRYCDMILLVVEGQDFKCSGLNPLLLFISKVHDRMKTQQLEGVSNVPTKTATRRKKDKKARMVIAKLFALHANAIILSVLKGFTLLLGHPLPQPPFSPSESDKKILDGTLSKIWT